MASTQETILPNLYKQVITFCLISIAFVFVILGSVFVAPLLVSVLTIYFFYMRRHYFTSYIYFPILLFPLVYLTFRSFGIEEKYVFSSGLIGFDVPPEALIAYYVGFICFAIGFESIATKRNVPLSSGSKPSKLIKQVLLILYFIGLVAGLAIYIDVQGIPLLDISKRWAQDPKLTLIMMTHMVTVPAIFCYYHLSGEKSRLPAIFLAVSLIMMVGYGARNIPVKLLISTFLTVILLEPHKTTYYVKRAGAAVLVFMFVIGSITKSSIYDLQGVFEIPLTLLYTDVAGTLYNFSRIVMESDPLTGFYGDFRMYLGSLKKMVPGADAFYANFYVTEIVNGSFWTERSINGTIIYSPMSLSPGFFGIGYASFGTPGLIFESTILGALTAKCYNVFKREKILAFIPGCVGAIFCYAAYAGYLGLDSLYIAFLIILLSVTYPLWRRYIFRRNTAPDSGLAADQIS